MLVSVILNNLIVGVQPSAFPDLPLSEQSHADLQPVDVTNAPSPPQVGYAATRSGDDWTFVAQPAPPPSTLAQQAASLLVAGLAISSTGTPALDGTYATDALSQQHISAEVTSILLNGTFADGAATVTWLDMSGGSHTFTVAQFKTFASAVAAFVAGCLKVINGQSTTLPAATATIP